MNTLKIASWNVKSLTDNKPKLLAKTAANLGIDIVILQETRRDMTHGERAGNAYNLWCTKHDGTYNHGVGFLVHRDVQVVDFKPYRIAGSDARAAQLIIETKSGRRSLYSLYAPHAGLGDDLVQTFWDEAQELPNAEKSIIGGDCNGHVHPNAWEYPATHHKQVLPIPPTNECGKRILEFANKLHLRPANMMRVAQNWEARHTFNTDGRNTSAPASVLDFIFIPTSRSKDFADGASPRDLPRAEITSDHKMLTVTWAIKTHSAAPQPSSRPTMAPEPAEEGTVLSTADEIYRELFAAAQQIHEAGSTSEAACEQHVKYALWIPETESVDKLRALVLRLKRAAAHHDTILGARKRLADAQAAKQKMGKKANWEKIGEAFNRRDVKQGFQLLSRSTKKTPLKRFHLKDHINEHERFKKILSHPPQAQPIVPPPEDIPHYDDTAEISLEQEELANAFKADTSHATFVDGSFSKDLLESTSSCGWAAYNTNTLEVFFGSAPQDSAHSANHGETLAILGAQTFCEPKVIATDSAHVELTMASLATEAPDDMRHIENGGTWREIWRHQGINPVLVVKVPGHAGIIPNEIAHIFAGLGANLPPGTCTKCTLKPGDVSKLASIDTTWNDKNTRARKRYAESLTQEIQPALVFSDVKNPPRRAADHVPTEQEIRRVLGQLNTDAAAGPDGIKPRDLRDPRITPILVRLIQEIWKTKLIPKHWLKSFLIGIPKPHDTCTRGIALTSTCLKVLTAIIRHRAADFSLLSSQWGFRTHRGTAQATTLLREMLNRRAAAGLGSTVIAIDLTKAFDSVRRDRLQKLLLEYGYGEVASLLVKQIYDGDTMYLYLNNENRTVPLAPEKGVKQGCLLSTGIFNLFIDRALRTMMRDFPNITGSDPTQGPLVLAYADDMAIVARNDAEALAFMTRFAEVLASYGLEINAKKTKVLRSLPRTHEAAQSGPTYKKRQDTQGQHPGAWAKPCALIDLAGRAATAFTTRAVLHMPSGNECNLTCSHCTFVAMTGFKTTPQKRMSMHVKRHLKKDCNMTTHVTLFGTPHGFGWEQEAQEHRTAMTDAQSRTCRPLHLPDVRCGTMTFEAVDQIVYLGSTIHQDGKHDAELSIRLASAAAAYGTLKRQVDNENSKVKVWLYDVFVSSRLLFGMETWAQTKAQLAKINSTRMRHLRTLTNSWPRGVLKDNACREHNEFAGVWHRSSETECKTCKAKGTPRFYYARHFLIELNSRRNHSITKLTHALYATFRNQKATGRRNVNKLVNLISEFCGLRAPNWLTHWLPMPSQQEILRHWDLPTTENMIVKRRANLLGSLVRHRALPKNDIGSGSRVSWWQRAEEVAGHLKLSLDEAHNVTFWRNAFYAVAIGRQTGVFDHWKGKDGTGCALGATSGHTGAIFKGFKSLTEAKQWLLEEHGFTPENAAILHSEATPTKVPSAPRITEATPTAHATPPPSTTQTPKRSRSQSMELSPAPGA